MGSIHSAGESVKSVSSYAESKYSNDPKAKSSFIQSAKTANHGPDGDNAAVTGAPIESVTLVFVTLAALALAGAAVL